jgi:hypothetical protein
MSLGGFRRLRARSSPTYRQIIANSSPTHRQVIYLEWLERVVNPRMMQRAARTRRAMLGLLDSSSSP